MLEDTSPTVSLNELVVSMSLNCVTSSKFFILFKGNAAGVPCLLDFDFSSFDE